LDDIADMAPHCASLDADYACLSVPAIIAVEQHARLFGAEPDPRDLLRPFRAALTTKIRSPHRRPCHSTTSRISPMRLGTRFDRRSTLRFDVIAPAAPSRAFENPHEYAISTRP